MGVTVQYDINTSAFGDMNIVHITLHLYIGHLPNNKIKFWVACNLYTGGLVFISGLEEPLIFHLQETAYI
jgi:hypothetical protein